MDRRAHKFRGNNKEIRGNAPPSSLPAAERAGDLLNQSCGDWRGATSPGSMAKPACCNVCSVAAVSFPAVPVLCSEAVRPSALAAAPSTAKSEFIAVWSAERPGAGGEVGGLPGDPAAMLRAAEVLREHSREKACNLAPILPIAKAKDERRLCLAPLDLKVPRRVEEKNSCIPTFSSATFARSIAAPKPRRSSRSCRLKISCGWKLRSPMPAWKMPCIHRRNRWKGAGSEVGGTWLWMISPSDDTSELESSRTPHRLNIVTILATISRGRRTTVSPKVWNNSNMSSTSKGPNPASFHTSSS
mmetsp:Transcript_59419/g.172164  ORF Transcript_59419/g.172164 Transcript_59419/m.172164 type:complete len:301 (+) Transcript_59419:55-957(+)